MNLRLCNNLGIELRADGRKTDAHSCWSLKRLLVRQYLLQKKTYKFRTKVGKNPLPYIEKIPYDNTYIIAKTAQELGISMGEVSACTTLFYKEVVENLKDLNLKLYNFQE